MHSKHAPCWRLRVRKTWALDPACLQQALTEPLTRMEMRSSAATRITERRQRAQRLQSGQGELPARTAAGVSLAPSASAPVLTRGLHGGVFAEGDREDRPFSALHPDPQGWPL